MKLYQDVNHLLDWAWGVIANASGGDWDKESKGWKKAAERWRDAYSQYCENAKSSDTPLPRVPTAELVGKYPFWWRIISGDLKPVDVWIGNNERDLYWSWRGHATEILDPAEDPDEAESQYGVITNTCEDVVERAPELPPIVLTNSIDGIQSWTNTWVPRCPKCGSSLEGIACPDGNSGCAVFHTRCPKCKP